MAAGDDLEEPHLKLGVGVALREAHQRRLPLVAAVLLEFGIPALGRVGPGVVEIRLEHRLGQVHIQRALGAQQLADDLAELIHRLFGVAVAAGLDERADQLEMRLHLRGRPGVVDRGLAEPLLGILEVGCGPLLADGQFRHAQFAHAHAHQQARPVLDAAVGVALGELHDGRDGVVEQVQPLLAVVDSDGPVEQQPPALVAQRVVKLAQARRQHGVLELRPPVAQAVVHLVAQVVDVVYAFGDLADLALVFGAALQVQQAGSVALGPDQHDLRDLRGGLVMLQCPAGIGGVGAGRGLAAQLHDGGRKQAVALVDIPDGGGPGELFVGRAGGKLGLLGHCPGKLLHLETIKGLGDVVGLDGLVGAGPLGKGRLALAQRRRRHRRHNPRAPTAPHVIAPL
jgi:hypothetical protein